MVVTDACENGTRPLVVKCEYWYTQNFKLCSMNVYNQYTKYLFGYYGTNVIV